MASSIRSSSSSLHPCAEEGAAAPAPACIQSKRRSLLHFGVLLALLLWICWALATNLYQNWALKSATQKTHVLTLHPSGSPKAKEPAKRARSKSLSASGEALIAEDKVARIAPLPALPRPRLAPQQTQPLQTEARPAIEPAGRPLTFVAYNNRRSIFLTPQEAAVSFLNFPPKSPHNEDARIVTVTMRLIGSNPAPSIDTGHARPPDTKMYSQVRYKNAYPGVDIVYHNDFSQLRYTFFVKDAAGLAPIRLRFVGPAGVRVARDGSLLLVMSRGELRWQAPLVQCPDPRGRWRNLAARYVLTASDEVSIAAATHPENAFATERATFPASQSGAPASATR